MDTLLKYVLITLLAVSLMPAFALIVLLAAPLLAGEIISATLWWRQKQQPLGSQRFEKAAIYRPERMI